LIQCVVNDLEVFALLFTIFESRKKKQNFGAIDTITESENEIRQNKKNEQKNKGFKAKKNK